jgi:hypothetical protein
MNDMSEFKQEWRCYKPKNDGKGAASKLQIVVKEKKVGDKVFPRVLLFLTSAPQDGVDENKNARFLWDSDEKTNVCLGEPDVADMLLVLGGVKDGLGTLKGDKWSGLFHQNEKAKTNSIINLTRLSGGFALSVSTKSGNNSVRVGHMISWGEGEILKILLTEYIKRRYDW